MKRVAGFMLIFGPLFATVLLWLLATPLRLTNLDSSTVFLALGQLAGLLGLTFFAVSLYLSPRVMGGLLTPGEVSYWHHKFGSWGIILMFLHPIILAFRYLVVSPQVAADFLLARNSTVDFYGLLALVVLTWVTFSTYYLKKYRAVWIWSHRFALAAYFLSFLHLMLVTSDVSRYPVLKYLLLSVMMAGVAGFTYQRIKASRIKAQGAVL